MLELKYSGGTIVIKGDIPSEMLNLDYIKYDERINAYRCFAYKYLNFKKFLNLNKIEHIDKVFNLIQGNCEIKKHISLRDFQIEAIEKWEKNGKRGIIVVPTGTGKTYIGLSIISFLKMPTLIVVPTLELMDQWYSRMKEHFNAEIGRFGGGIKEIKFFTVSTYDSAYINAEIFGNKFFFMIFDEVHHLPSEGYRQIAMLSVSPYRLGLTATPEREDGLHEILPEIVGEIVYRKEIPQMTGKYLAKFEILRYYVNLNEEEREKYEKYRSIFKKFFEENKIEIRTLDDFYFMILRSGKDRKAREALLAWNEARKIALNASEKMKVLSEILEKHRKDRIIIFTEHNKLAREISKQYLIPEITYKTPEKERILTMEKFRRGIYSSIVTSKVLEEGIDVPEANVAIILSGSGSRREFIQRLGRILRPSKEKRAALYEIVTRGTSEVNISYRRRIREEIFE